MMVSFELDFLNQITTSLAKAPVPLLPGNCTIYQSAAAISELPVKSLWCRMLTRGRRMCVGAVGIEEQQQEVPSRQGPGTVAFLSRLERPSPSPRFPFSPVLSPTLHRSSSNLNSRSGFDHSQSDPSQVNIPTAHAIYGS